MKNVPDDSKLIQVINILTVVTVYCFFVPSILTQRKIKMPFFR